MSQFPDVSTLRLNDTYDRHAPATSTSRPTSSSHQRDPSNPKARGANTSSDENEARDASLRAELDSVRKVNQVIEGVLSSLEKAKGNMETVNRTVTSATTLLDTWTRILSRTEHTQRLLLHPAWNGATQDLADAENDTAQRQRAQEAREAEEERRREALDERKRVEEERRREVAATPKARGRGLGRVGSMVGSERASSAACGQAGGGSASASASQRGTAAARRAALSGYGRVRGRAAAGTKRGAG